MPSRILCCVNSQLRAGRKPAKGSTPEQKHWALEKVWRKPEKSSANVKEGIEHLATMLVGVIDYV